MTLFIKQHLNFKKLDQKLLFWTQEKISIINLPKEIDLHLNTLPLVLMEEKKLIV